ncbi:MAG: 50S ribosomal protein L4 [candidate division Zixibacteria bacterium]|nr:50S ribosomal protein L4 [candidate division Zixibacteria bacterium]
MVNLDIYDINGSKVGDISLEPNIFEHKVNEKALHQYVKAYLANQRQGTVSKKGRSEVRGGGVKPWKQKGTGRARAGSIRSPIWVGGGRTFAPKPRDFRVNLPRKIKREALISALSDKMKESKIKIIDRVSLDKPKTKTIAELLKKLGIEKNKSLFLFEGKDENLIKSTRNIGNLSLKRAQLVNGYDILNCDYLLMDKSAVQVLQEVFSK